MRGVNRALTLFAFFSLIGAGACVRRSPQSNAKPREVRLVTGTPGGGFYPVGQSLAGAYRNGVPPLTVEHRESAGSISNVMALQRADADIALAYADVAYFAFAGTLAGHPNRFDRLRGIAVLQRAPLHLVVRAGSGIQDVAGLRGQRVGVGTQGSGTALTAGLVLNAFGIDPKSVRTEQLRYNDAAARLAAGDLDAMFVIGADPVDAVRVATNAGGRILPLAGSAIERLRDEYPFFRAAVIRAGAYPGVATAVRTIGVENLLLCRSDLDEELVHDLTARLFASLPSMPLLRTMDLEQAPAVPIPLHDGAARFYRERELFR
jgi:TRAP transporter TAXI family solute receptor